jgi:Hint-domain/VWA / Hh  protein intein-like/von Willebrand factor type A domain
MTSSGKKRVLGAIDRLNPHGSTNLWDGLKAGMNLLNDDFTKNSGEDITPSHRVSTLFILTDGMPIVHPPRGHIPMLKSYLDAHSTTQPFSISTFGFGYSLDTPLLLEIAQVGGGGYGFIPDSGMVGTVFVHAVANAYSTYAPRTKVDVEVPDGTDVRVGGGLPVIKTSWGVQIDAGDIQYGQSRHYILSFDIMPATIAATARYRPFNSAHDVNSDTVILDNTAVPDQAGIGYHTARLDLVEILFSTKTTNLSASTEALEFLQRRITGSPILANHADALAVAQDASGEGLLALQPLNFARWGRHYFPSLARAHQRQQCGNFRDPGLQVYGRDSPVFIEERDHLDAAFYALPPPTPSIPFSYSGPGRSQAYGRPPPQLSSMAAYHSLVGPCFSAHCLLTGIGGTQVRVEQLKRGMEVMTLKGLRKVAAVVRTTSPSGEEHLCRIGDGLEITPWHPIRAQGQFQDKWVFPADIVAAQTRTCDAVYSILLMSSDANDADAHSVSIGGVWCVTLGHGLLTSKNGDVRAHPFLGSYEKVLKEITKLDGFYDADGVVESFGTKRTVDGKICGFIGEMEGQQGGNLYRPKSVVYV